ncbi:MAG: LamG-like jellyroll fold domain-containing protein [Phycisphaerales bacterium]
MCRIIHSPSSTGNRNRGIALLMVLLIVLAVTIISAGFIAQADVELASGGNMLMHVQTDQLAHSGLEHAKGLLLRPHLVSAVQIHPTDFYWEGSVANLLLAGSNDSYDVEITRDPTDFCTYYVTSEAYRERASDGERIGQTTLTAELRLDPCLAMWTKVNTTLRPNWTVQGDVCTNGTLTVAPTASLDGDAFATQLIGTSIGQRYAVSDLPVIWPGVTASFFSSTNFITVVAVPVMSGTYTTVPPAPKRIYACSGDVSLAAGTTIYGMLRVAGDLTVAGSGCSITTVRNLPALYVGGDLLLDAASNLTVTGLTVVDGNLRIHSDVSNVRFIGGLCLAGTIAEATADASGNGLTGTLCGNPTWETNGALGGALRFDGSDDSVACGNNAVLDLTTGLTVAAWVKAERADATAQETLVVKSGAYSLAIQSSNVVFAVYSDSAAAWKVVQFPVGAGFNGAWHHVAGTFDGSTLALYVDGALQGSTAYAGAIASRPANSLSLGSDGVKFYQGTLDDVHVYSRALSLAEVGQIGVGGSVLNLVARWQLDGPGSQVAITADPTRGAVIINGNSATQYWSPAGGAFFRSIERQ